MATKRPNQADSFVMDQAFGASQNTSCTTCSPMAACKGARCCQPQHRQRTLETSATHSLGSNKCLPLSLSRSNALGAIRQRETLAMIPQDVICVFEGCHAPL